MLKSLLSSRTQSRLSGEYSSAMKICSAGMVCAAPAFLSASSVSSLGAGMPASAFRTIHGQPFYASTQGGHLSDDSDEIVVVVVVVVIVVEDEG